MERQLEHMTEQATNFLPKSTLSKKQVINHLTQYLHKKITAQREQIESLKESRNSDGKNSAGDKYETGVEMIQQEIGQAQQQIDQFKKQLDEVQRAQTHNDVSSIGFGNLVITDQDQYFLAIGLGQLDIEGKNCYCISMQSPFGMALLGKTKGDEVIFNSNKHLIKEIL